MPVIEVLKQRPDAREIAQTAVGEQLATLEAAVEAALVEAARLTLVMSSARRDLNLSAVVGDQATHGVARAGALLAEARSAVTGAHGTLDRLQRKLGMRPAAFGPPEKPPETPPPPSGVYDAGAVG